MRRRNTDSNTAYCTVSEFCRRSGLSQKYIRQALRDGTMPHIMVGNTYMIPAAEALAALADQAKANTAGME